MLLKLLYAFFTVICSCLLSIKVSNGDRIKDVMYINIDSSIGCFRRMNSTHQIGCSSEKGGSMGIIHYCDNLADLEFIITNGSAEKYIPILSTSMLTEQGINTLISNKAGKINGLILHSNNSEPLEQYSHENKCPNELFSYKQAQCPRKGWNPWGTGLLYRDIPFPIFYVEDESKIMLMKECFQQFNNFSYSRQTERVLCALQLNSFMYGSTNTPTCRRRSNINRNINPLIICDPLGDNNVWGSLFPLVKVDLDSKLLIPINDFKYIIITARLDTTSLFDKTAGAESPVTGTVTLLTVAKLLKEILPKWDENYKTNVLFIFFNGETYDYIGSQRFLYDMENGDFPTYLAADDNKNAIPTIFPENISLFIELAQFSSDKIFAHYIDDNNNNNIKNFISNLTTIAATTNITLNSIPNSLPPSSLHTFLKSNTSSIDGLVLTNHKNEFSNKFYNSLYDNSSNIGYEYFNGSKIEGKNIQKYVAEIATIVTKSVYQKITNKPFSKEIKINLTLIDELFNCYLEDTSCKLHKAMTTSKGDLPKIPLSLYVGVNRQDNFFTSFIALSLAYFIGDVVGASDANCTNSGNDYTFKYYNMSSDIDNLNKTECLRATVFLSEAVSPAFIIEDYDWSSNKYSSWTESSWGELNMRIFLKPSTSHEYATLIIGSLTMIFSFIAVYVIKAHSNTIFNYPITVVETSPANC